MPDEQIPPPGVPPYGPEAARPEAIPYTVPPPPNVVAQREQETRRLERAGWLLTAVTLLVPFLALGAVAIGGVLISRDRVDRGVAMIVVSLAFATLRVALALS
jgi:hypothetical protein